MNSVVELHDSECLAIESSENGFGLVVLNAYVHRGEGDPLASPHEGGYQRIQMKIGGMMTHGLVGDLPADIYQGSVVIGREAQGVIPLPVEYAAAVRLSMTLSPDGRVTVISGTGLAVEPCGEFQFTENRRF
jgi:hypothetical protein